MQLLKEQTDGVMVGVLKEIESMLARGRLDLPITLCFAVTRGDDHLLHQLLKRNLDPNESDQDGRTALVSMLVCILYSVRFLLSRKVTLFIFMIDST